MAFELVVYLFVRASLQRFEEQTSCWHCQLLLLPPRQRQLVQLSLQLLLLLLPPLPPLLPLLPDCCRCMLQPLLLL
jgi:hypothetical protein